jgi:hypothetical protein
MFSNSKIFSTLSTFQDDNNKKLNRTSSSPNPKKSNSKKSPSQINSQEKINLFIVPEAFSED